MVITKRLINLLQVFVRAYESKSVSVEFWKFSLNRHQQRRLRMLADYEYISECGATQTKYSAYRITPEGLAFYDQWLFANDDNLEETEED